MLDGVYFDDRILEKETLPGWICFGRKWPWQAEHVVHFLVLLKEIRQRHLILEVVQPQSRHRLQVAVKLWHNRQIHTK